MADPAFTRIRANPFPTTPPSRLRRALARQGIDTDQLLAGEGGHATLAPDEHNNALLLCLSDHCANGGIDSYRELISILSAAGAHVYAFCEPGAGYAGSAEIHAPDGTLTQICWSSGKPLLDQESVEELARESERDTRSLPDLPDQLVGAAVKRAFAAFAAAP
jgi:hypothetical protein